MTLTADFVWTVRSLSPHWGREIAGGDSVSITESMSADV